MKNGFSLVELSIVLVILGLLTGGILAGQSLIRASELRAVTTEYNRWVTATQSFRDKYFGIPGDITNATKFWPAADGGDGLGVDCTGIVTTTATTATCNGDGNGWISGGGNDMYRYWQQLGNAGLVEGSFTGTQASAGNQNHHTGGLNCPRSKMASASWALRNLDTADAAGQAFNYDRRNTFIFGRESGTSWQNVPLMKPEEAWNIDTKIDDGRPGRGKVESNFNVCTDAAGNTSYDANYALSSTAISCLMFFGNAF